MHQLWDRANDLNAGITTFVTQRPPETVQRWINRLVFPVELLLLSGVALLLCQSTPALTAFFAVYLLLTAVNIKTAPHPFTPSPPKGQNIIPHDLYEVWLPLALAITLAVQNPQFLIFMALTAMLFYPSIKVRVTELFQVIKAGFTPMPNPTPSTPEAPRPTPSNVAPLTPAMQQQLETEGYVVLENFLTPDELEDLRELVSTDPLPENAENLSSYTLFSHTDPALRQHHNNCLKSIVSTKLTTLLPNHRTAFCTWYRKSPNSSTNATKLHQDPSLTDETDTLSYGIWCPLTDVTPENGCLSVVKGSHLLNSKPRPFYPFAPFPYDSTLASLIQDNYLTPIPLKAGQAILYDKRLFHGASPNTQHQEPVAFTCLIAPQNTLTHFGYQASAQSETLELYAVEDDFYHRYILGEKPSGEGVTLIKTEPYTYDPLTPERIAEKLDPLHPDRTISRLKTQLDEQHRQHQTELDALQQSRSQLQGELTAANEQLHQKNSELATLKEDYSQTDVELQHLREQLQTTQTQLRQTQAELERDRTELQTTRDRFNEGQTQQAATQAELQQTQAELGQLKAYLQQTQGTAGMLDYYQFRIASEPDNIQLYRQALTVDPNNVRIYQELGKALTRHHCISEAIATYQTALELQPDNFEIYLELGKIFHNQEN